MNAVENFLKEQQENNRPTPEQLARARGFAERAATARFGPRPGGEFNEAAYLASLKSTESGRESAKRYCETRNRK